MSKRSHDLAKTRKKLPKDDPNYSSDESDYIDDKPAQSIDFSRIWLTVRSKPHDFTSWCSLLQLAEQENKLGLIRKAFNEFFKHYPYCYAYWKKYCDLERRHGHNYHAKRVVKRGLEANSMSVDLWIYCIELYSSRYMAEYQHMQSKKRREAEKAKKAKRDKDEADPEFDEDGNPIIREDDDEDEDQVGPQNDDDNDENNEKSDDEPDLDEIYKGKDGNSNVKFYDDGHSSGQLSPARIEKLRKLYWKAVAACGKQFKCGRLWNKFVYFERQNGNIDKVLPIYNEILRIPMDDYNKQFTEMKEFVQDSADPSELIEDSELRAICKELLEDKNANLGIGDQGDQAYRLAKAGELSEDALDQIRKGIIDKRRELFKENEKKVARIWNFEDNIKRPYFHVKPLDKGQLRNWIEYLDYEVDSGTPEHVVKNLFERCLVTTALYEDFWLKYANWAEYKAKNVELARSCYKRCCEIHLPKRANCRIEWATFEERHGQLEQSRLILEDLNDRVPGLLAVSARLFHLKRRTGRFTDEQLIGSLKTEWANSQEFRDRDGPEKELFWACELAWYLCRAKRIGEARNVLDSAIERSPGSSRLFRVRAEIEQYDKNLFGWCDRMCEIYERAANNDRMETWERVTFSGHLYGILERESKDLDRISAAYDLHRVLRKELQREQIRHQKSLEEDGEEVYESHDPGTGYTMKRVTQDNKGMFLNAPENKGPTIKTNVPSQRVADYSEVGGNYHTYQSSGAYGNSYTWQYNKGGK